MYIRRTFIMAAIALLAVSSAGAAAAAAAAAARPAGEATGIWGKAEQVAAALNRGEFVTTDLARRLCGSPWANPRATDQGFDGREARREAPR